MGEKLHVIKFPLPSSSSSNNIPFFLGGEGGRGKLAERAILEWGQPDPTRLGPTSSIPREGEGGEWRYPPAGAARTWVSHF